MGVVDGGGDGLVGHGGSIGSSFFIFGKREVEAEGGDAFLCQGGCQGGHKYMIHAGACPMRQCHDEPGCPGNGIFGRNRANGRRYLN